MVKGFLRILACVIGALVIIQILVPIITGTSQPYSSTLQSKMIMQILQAINTDTSPSYTTASPVESAKPNISRPKANRSIHGHYLSFETCGGMTNQRIALVQGLMIANITSRMVVLPKMNRYGAEDPDKMNQIDRHNHMVAFDDFYDLPHLEIQLNQTLRLASRDVELDQLPLSQSRKIKAKNGMMEVDEWRNLSRFTQILGESSLLMLDCTFFAIDIRRAKYLKNLFWLIDSAIKPSAWVKSIASHIIQGLQSRSAVLGGNGYFNALHLRVGPDWDSHCRHWGTNDRDNCLTNTNNVLKALTIEGLPTNIPLYVVLDVPLLDVSRTIIAHEWQETYDLTYDLLTKEMLWPHDKHALTSNFMYREILATIDYEICSAAQTFIGNSVSNFSALQLLRRQWLGPPEQGTMASFHYNAGRIPLADVLYGKGGSVNTSRSENLACYVARNPDIFQSLCKYTSLQCKWKMIANHWHRKGKSVESRPRECDPRVSTGKTTFTASRLSKWVFAVNSDTDSFDQMIKVAVLSARKFTSLIPVAVVTGTRTATSAIVKWLRCVGVRIIVHKPAWADSMSDFGLDQTTPFAFMRLELPNLGLIDDYILYADVDVIFTGEVEPTDFGVVMPTYFSIGAESEKNQIGGSMGVMLMNIRNMRRRYNELIDWVFSSENRAKGFIWNGQPGDQGALMAFFADSYQVIPEPLFNWRPYWGFNPAAKLIHFHGPTPSDYAQYFASGNALALFDRFFYQCEAAYHCKRYIDMYMNFFKISETRELCRDVIS